MEDKTMERHLSGKTARLLYTRLQSAPADYFRSKDGRRIQAKALVLIRSKDGRRAAREFRDVLHVLATV
jgi:hypothetical protein